MGIMQFDRTRNYESLESLKKSLEIGIKLKDSVLVSKSYRALASTYSNLGNFNLSIQNIYKALPIFEKLNDEFEIGNTYTELASNLHRNKKYDDALNYNKKALAIFISKDNKIREAVTYNNMSNNLNGLKQYKQSINNSRKADSLFKNLGYERFTAYTKGNMAIAYDSLKLYNKAESLYKLAIDIHNEHEEYYELSFLQNALANLYLKKKDYTKALEVANIALSNALKVDALEFETYSNKTLGELYKKINIPQKASYHFENYAILKDSLFKIEEQKTQLELKEQYEAAARDKEIAQQKEELLAQQLVIKNRNLYALIITSILLILGIIYYAFLNAIIKKTTT
ncbi:MAG: tetratricopeptide repeat protein [Polaribacter sp.]|nr:tetratricopeptide repeat protein [Polaribacter sp.]